MPRNQGNNGRNGQPTGALSEGSAPVGAAAIMAVPVSGVAYGVSRVRG